MGEVWWAGVLLSYIEYVLGECPLWTGEEGRESSEEHVAQSWANWTVEGLFVRLGLPSSEWLLHLTRRRSTCRAMNRSPLLQGQGSSLAGHVPG